MAGKNVNENRISSKEASYSELNLFMLKKYGKHLK